MSKQRIYRFLIYLLWLLGVGFWVYAGSLASGGFVTNTTSTADLAGPFNTYSFNTPIGGVQFGNSGGTWIFSVMGGPEFGASGGSYPTNTWSTGH